MLSDRKRICRKCWLRRGNLYRWNSDGNSSWQCNLVYEEKITETSGIPKVCPYRLEHMMVDDVE